MGYPENITPSLDAAHEAHSLPNRGYNKQVEEDMNKEVLRQLVELKAKQHTLDETDKESNINDGGTSCFVTGTISDIEDDPFKSSLLV